MIIEYFNIIFFKVINIYFIILLIYTGVFNNYKIAIGTSLASLLLPIGIFAVIFYNRIKCGKERCINWKYAFILSIFFTIGTLASYFSVKLNSNIYKLIFAYKMKIHIFHSLLLQWSY